MTVIDRTSPVPYYEQLYATLLDRIRGGAIRTQARLPSESELHREFALSRGTVRQALELLEASGWAVRVPRRGYFASAPPSDRGWLIEGTGGFLEDELGERPGVVATTVVRADRSRLPEHARLALGIEDPGDGFVLERRRTLDRQRVVFSTNFSPPQVGMVIAAAEHVLSGSGSLTQALREAGFVARGSHRLVHAMPAPPEVSRHLGVAGGSPLLRVRAVTWDADQNPFDYYETWLRSERVPLELSTTAPPSALAATA